MTAFDTHKQTCLRPYVIAYIQGGEHYTQDCSMKQLLEALAQFEARGLELVSVMPICTE